MANLGKRYFLRRLTEIGLVLGLLLVGSSVEAWAEERFVHVYGWADYVDPSVLEDFSKETGITLTYDVYESEAAMNAKLLAGTSGYDVVIVSSALLRGQIAAGVYQKLDRTKLPRSQQLDPAIMVKMARYDLGNQYALPYLWFTLGIGYDVEKAKEKLGESEASREVLKSWEAIFKPEIVKKFTDCGVAIFDNREALLSIALRYLKLDPDSKNPNDLKRAADLLAMLRRTVKSFEPLSSAAALARGDLCLVVDQSATIFQAKEQAREMGGEIEFSLPREGTLLLFDALAIPKDAAHVAEAHQLIDYLLRPEIAARNSNATRFATAVGAAMPLVAPELTDNKSIYLDASSKALLFILPSYNETTQKWLSREWAPIKTGK
jgi:putrescine transport system substrate-binding protein